MGALLMLSTSCKKKDDNSNSNNKLTGTVADIDGNLYHTITIGTQVWMVENLKVTKYRNGDLIPIVTDNTQWGSLTTSAYCNYNNDANNASICGRLYNWYAATDARDISPPGWHVASFNDFDILITYLGGDSLAGGKMRETGTVHWGTPNTTATNESGFTGLPAGCRNNSDGSFFGIGNEANWGTSSVFNTSWVWIIRMYGDKKGIDIDGGWDRGFGSSIRCVKD